MIVSCMNNGELVREILLDKLTVERKARYLSADNRRMALKSKDPYYSRLFEYKSIRKNNWLIEIDYSKGLPTYFLIVYFLNEHGLNAITMGEDQNFYWYTSHFLKRYNERILKQENISKLELLKHFISVNKTGVFDYEDNGRYVSCRFPEGIGLGDLETINYQVTIYHFRTFISDQMVFDEQQRIIEWARSCYQQYGQELQKITGIKSL